MKSLIIIPAFNEEIAIGSVVKKSLKYVDDVLVIDDLEDDFMKLKPSEVVERFCYSGEVNNIKHRFLRGEEI